MSSVCWSSGRLVIVRIFPLRKNRKKRGCAAFPATSPPRSVLLYTATALLAYCPGPAHQR